LDRSEHGQPCSLFSWFQLRRIFDASRMDDASMRSRAFWTAAAAGALALALAGAGHAQDKPDPTEKRFQSLEKQLHQLRDIVLQAKDTGQPVQVRVSGEPDPQVASLQQRIDDLEQAARTRNDQIDTLTHDLAMARKDAADSKTALSDIQDRLGKIEAQLKSIQDAQAAAPQAPGPVAEGAPPPADAGAAGPPPPEDLASANEAFRRAKQLLLQGQYATAGDAFQRFVDRYGDTPNGPEARYWLGETLYIRGLYPDAATAYIGAIRGWPQSTWAPDAVVKLARALVALNKPTDACRALVEFDRHYPGATPPTKAKAQDVRAAAKCKV
jgi:tol-pal system protein YbgF